MTKKVFKFRFLPIKIIFYNNQDWGIFNYLTNLFHKFYNKFNKLLKINKTAMPNI